MDANDSASDDSERSEEHSRENIYYFRKYLNHLTWIVRINTDRKDSVCGGTKGNGIYVTANWKKGNSCFIGVEI